jgi:hypothetical protein
MKMGTYPMFGYVPIFLLAAFAAWGAEPEATVTVLKEGGARLDWLGERIAFDMLGPDDLFAVAAGSRDRGAPASSAKSRTLPAAARCTRISRPMGGGSPGERCGRQAAPVKGPSSASGR